MVGLALFGAFSSQHPCGLWRRNCAGHLPKKVARRLSWPTTSHIAECRDSFCGQWVMACSGSAEAGPITVDTTNIAIQNKIRQCLCIGSIVLVIPGSLFFQELDNIRIFRPFFRTIEWRKIARISNIDVSPRFQQDHDNVGMAFDRSRI